MLESELPVEQLTNQTNKQITDSTVGFAPERGDGIASMIDHTLLKQDAGEEAIRTLCREAREYRFASVCVNPCYVSLCARELHGSGVNVCTVIGFPLGATTTSTKVFEAVEAVENSAREVDMVVNVGIIKSGDWDYIRNDIASVVTGVSGKALVKVIIETCLLTDEEKTRVCRICREVGADFVKTSTGFSSGGATAEDVALMRRVVGPGVGVKASGGIKDAQTAQAMVAAGANRLGTSASVACINGQKRQADSSKRTTSASKQFD